MQLVINTVESVNINLSAYVSKMATQYFESIIPIKQAVLNKEIDKPGQVLYHDKRLSKTGNILYNYCHNVEAYGADNIPASSGGEQNNCDRNSPTVLNANDYIAQFWV